MLIEDESSMKPVCLMSMNPRHAVSIVEYEEQFLLLLKDSGSITAQIPQLINSFDKDIGVM